MDSIVKEKPFSAIGDCMIGCIMVGDEPYFNSIDLCSVLGFADKDSRKQALKTHVDPVDKTNIKSLLCQVRGGKNIPMDASVGKVIFINESGLYSLAFGSKKPFARLFKRWVTSEVLPAIRKTGSYSNYRYSRNEAELGTTKQERWKKVHELAVGKEDELHYSIKNHIAKEYPDAVIHAGIGEHLTTDHARMDVYLKGYTKGEPDITIIRKLPNSFQDVLAIELKNPNGKGKLEDYQEAFHQLLKEQCNVQTIVGHDYDTVIFAIRDHYQEVFARAQTLAITDKPQHYDFSKNPDPQYWCNKLKNKQGLVDECTKRQIPDDGIWIKTNREIASILITFDTNA
jgi:prophage antirepressor-like protein